ncbi:GNAT family N-acetyltransferase [Lachnoclostridium sp. An169]|uniref:GNAT family N-acetyltransferase n=1 Tax=Lachnoclostridium sp. An169 TaxID=1965569 RepID=UPI000B3A7321|nr:N-acetyltransferase [Lachnoclostridium sp. An169]OUP84133.1 GNAT family N-acetyltransferase [Lachnoclostridium sp. An169]
MIIRKETEKDYEEVYRLIKEAFATAEHADGNEQDLVAALRKGESFIPELSLVAEKDGCLAGHILFTRALVGTDEVLVLAPLSVKPEYQRQGIGSALIAEGHRIAGEMGFEYALVLGSELYYPRFGYVPAEQLGVEVPDGMPSANFMAVRLRDDARPLHGAVTYAEEFGI